MKKKNLMPLDLQIFAEPAPQGGNEPPQNPEPTPGQNPQPTFTFEQMERIFESRSQRAGDNALKDYFKQQGLTQEEVTQALQDFKAQKAQNTPDVNALQASLQQAQADILKAQIENAVTLQAIKMGYNAETMPFLMKLIDTTGVTGQDGKISEKGIQDALEAAEKAFPQIKPQAGTASGFQVGAPGNQNNNQASQDALKAAFGLK